MAAGVWAVWDANYVMMDGNGHCMRVVDESRDTQVSVLFFILSVFTKRLLRDVRELYHQDSMSEI